MKTSVMRFVAVIAVVALGCGTASAMLPGSQPFPARLTDAAGLGIFVLLAATLEALSGVLMTSSGGGVSNSVAAIMYLAMIPLFGPFPAVLGTALAESISGLVVRRLVPAKAIFNIAQLAIASSAAGASYILLDGPITLAALTTDLATALAFSASAVVFFTVNYLLVTAVVSLDTGESFARTWTLVRAGGWPANLAGATVAFVLVLLYAKFQLLGVLALLLPLLFLHHSNHIRIKLYNLNRDLLRLIVKTIEAKDPYTSGHSVRVAQFCRRIAEEMRLPRKTVDLIETAALLHDFGKIDVAYEQIISQPGALTVQQREIIRSHPVRGAELLASISSLDKRVIEAVRHHHESFDGTGYPDHLAGTGIPLAARLLMVADTVDAMLSMRPYRAALSAESVEAELGRLRGRQFDPEIVDVVLANGFIRDFSRLVPSRTGTPVTRDVRAQAVGVAVAPRGF